jgi:DNA-directed RNA polymerase subunit A"
MSVTSGLPRLIEVFDATKSPKTPQIEVYLDKKHSKDPEAVKKMAILLKETTIEDVASEFGINPAHKRIEVVLDSSKMKELTVKPSEVLAALSANKKIIVKKGKNYTSIKPIGEVTLGELYNLKEKLRKMYVKGVKKITHVLPIKKGDEYMILTAGTNLKDILQVPGIDPYRTRSNDLYETAKILGIEAARQLIMEEAEKVIQSQGLDVDVRHIMLLSDVMTSKGAVKGITRSGITGEKESVLARASFETPIKHLIRASMIGEIDPLNSVIENVMMNQPIPLGTGLPDLVVKMEKKKKDKK